MRRASGRPGWMPCGARAGQGWGKPGARLGSPAGTRGAAMKRLGVEDFREHAARYLFGEESVEIERDGAVIGLYLPVKSRRREEVAEAMAHLEQVIREVTARTGLTEEELSDFFNLNKPLPEWAQETEG